MKTLTPIFTPEPLKQARESRSLTQSQLADALGATQSQISEIEKGRHKPSLPLLLKLCLFLNVSFPSLFFFENFNDNVDNHLTEYR
jgi:transcriptional regulator with XRE-family HTH domain